MSKRDTRRDTIVEHYPLLEGQEDRRKSIQRIVMLSIDPDSAKYVIDWALSNFIQPEKDLVILVHVRLLEMPMAPYADAAGYMDDAAEERKQESHDLLKQYASGLWAKQIACKAVSMIGDPKAELVRKAQESRADVLIMGSRKMGTIRRTLLGSVSDHCVHRAPCTVIIAKAPEPEVEKEGRRRSFLSRIRSRSISSS